MGHYLLHKAQTQGFRCINASPGEDQFQRLPLANEPRQSLRAATSWDNPERYLSQPQLRLLGGDPYIAAHRQLAAST